MDEVRIGLGFDEDERERVGELYWAAFGGKLSAAFRDRSIGRRVVTAAMSDDRVLVARAGGEVVGVCGFHRDGRGAARISYAQLRQDMSPLTAAGALVLLSVLERRERAGVVLLDGICVDDGRRGLGIGSQLLDAVTEYARSEGGHAVALSVIDNNPRAAALYLRHGFIITGRGRLGSLRHLFGFDGYTTMQKEVAA